MPPCELVLSMTFSLSYEAFHLGFNLNYFLFISLSPESLQLNTGRDFTTALFYSGAGRVGEMSEFLSL